MKLDSNSDKVFMCVAVALLFIAFSIFLSANFLFLPLSLYGLWLIFLAREFQDIRVRLLFSLRFAVVLSVATLVLMIL